MDADTWARAALRRVVQRCVRMLGDQFRAELWDVRGWL